MFDVHGVKRHTYGQQMSGFNVVYMGCDDVSEFDHIYGGMFT